MSLLIINKNGVVTRSSNNKQMTGEKIPGDLDSWEQYSTDPNKILQYSYGLLSERSSTLYHTHPPISAAIEKHVQYAIGPGLVFRSQPDSKTLNISVKEAKEWGSEFQRLIHYAFELLGWYEKQSTVFRTGKVQGDSLVLFDREEPPEGMPFDLIDVGGDHIDWEKVDTSLPESQEVTLGVLTDLYKRKKGLYLNGNESATEFKNETGHQNIIQFYEKLIARQLRGYPLAYRMIASGKNNDRLWDLILNRAALEASVIGVEKNDVPDVRAQMEALAKQARGGTETNSEISTIGKVSELSSGNILSIPTTGSFEFLDMKTPSNNFDKLQDSFIELVGMGTNTPPEVVKSMYSTSYTAHKGAFNDFIKSYMKGRSTFAKTVNNPIVLELAKFFISSGLISMPHKEFFTNPIIQLATISGFWLGPVPGHINPLQEVKAKAEEVTNAFKLRSSAAIENGREFEDHINQWIEEEKKWQEGTPEEKAEIINEELKDDQNNVDDDENKIDDDKKDDEV